MKYISEIEINKKDFERINRLMEVDFDETDENGDLTSEMQSLVNELDARPDTTPYSFCFEFANGSKLHMDISSDRTGYNDYCQWFSKDLKDDHLFDCAYKTFEENYFEYCDNIYVCKFIIKED